MLFLSLSFLKDCFYKKVCAYLFENQAHTTYENNKMRKVTMINILNGSVKIYWSILKMCKRSHGESFFNFLTKKLSSRILDARILGGEIAVPKMQL